MKSAIDAVPYAGAVKIGLQFKRRFWEEDDAIYGGISYTCCHFDAPSTTSRFIQGWINTRNTCKINNCTITDCFP